MTYWLPIPKFSYHYVINLLYIYSHGKYLEALATVVPFFLPAILSFAYYKDKKCFLHIPLIRTTYHMKYLQQQAKIEKEIRESKMQKKELSNYDLVQQKTQIKSDFNRFRLFEIFSQSPLQFIIQLSIFFSQNQDLTEMSTLKIITILTTFAGLSWNISSVYMTHPFCDVNGKEEFHNEPLKNTFKVLLPMIFIILPRLFILTIIFTTFTWWISIVITIGVVIVHFLVFFTITYTNQRKKQQTINYSKIYNQNWMLSFFTSIVAPCVIMDKKSKLLLFSSIASTIGYAILVSVWITMLIVFPNWLDLKTNYLSNTNVQVYFLIFLPASLILSAFFMLMLILFSHSLLTKHNENSKNIINEFHTMESFWDDDDDNSEPALNIQDHSGGLSDEVKGEMVDLNKELLQFFRRSIFQQMTE